MAEEKRSLLERLRYWLFGRKEEHRTDQKQRSEDLTTFLEEHAEGEDARAAAAQEKRRASGEKNP